MKRGIIRQEKWEDESDKRIEETKGLTRFEELED